MKQTAVEQFIEQLEKQGESWENMSIGRIQISIKVEDYLNLINQAKEMEKEQIIDAYIECKRQYVIQESCFPQQFVVKEAEQYYNETFNK